MYAKRNHDQALYNARIHRLTHTHTHTHAHTYTHIEERVTTNGKTRRRLSTNIVDLYLFDISTEESFEIRHLSAILICLHEPDIAVCGYRDRSVCVCVCVCGAEGGGDG